MSYYKDSLCDFIANWIDYCFDEFQQEVDVEMFYNTLEASNGVLPIAYTTSEYVDFCDIQASYDLNNQWLVIELNGEGKGIDIDTTIIKDLPIERASDCLDFGDMIWIGEEWICNHDLNEWD